MLTPAVLSDLVIPLLENGKQRPSSAGLSPVITYPAAVDEAVVSPPYIVSLVSPSAAVHPSSTGSTTPAPPDRPHFTLEVHTLSDLAPVQSLPVPRESPSPPASIAASSLAALHGGSGTSSRGPVHIARLLTLSSTSPKPPLLVLTAKSPNSSTTVSAPAGLTGAEQTLWAVVMKSWPDQIEELGREEGKWEQGIELLRGSFDALKDPLPVRPRCSSMEGNHATVAGGRVLTPSRPPAAFPAHSVRCPAASPICTLFTSSAHIVMASPWTRGSHST